jgi:hypothetical protein
MNRRRYELVMAVFPNTRGFAYVVFEGPLSPVDWGISDIRGKHRNHKCMRRIDRLITKLGPDILVLRDEASFDQRHSARLRQLIVDLEMLAESRAIPVAHFCRRELRRTFAYLGSPTRYAIVQSIAKHIPLFDRYVPPIRKIWKSEDRRMGLFDAAALCLTYFRIAQCDAGKLDNKRA